jgi:hypothetical protein
MKANVLRVQANTGYLSSGGLFVGTFSSVDISNSKFLEN